MKCPKCGKNEFEAEIFYVQRYEATEGFRVKESDLVMDNIVIVDGDANWDEVQEVQRTYFWCSHPCDTEFVPANDPEIQFD